MLNSWNNPKDQTKNVWKMKPSLSKHANGTPKQEVVVAKAILNWPAENAVTQNKPLKRF